MALNYALQRNPQDYKAKYYLGNFLYGRQRFDEGVRLWEEALPGLANFDVLYRNLGLAAWQREKDLLKATGYFERGLAFNTENQDLYLHLDDLYKAQGLDEQRWQLLEKIVSLPRVREDVRKRSVLMRVDLGHYEEALQILETEQFVPLEMDQSFHELYVRALMERAEAQIKAGKIEEAITDYRQALEFPANLGVGKPTTLAQAHIYYQMGLAYEQLGRFQEALQAWRNAAGEHHAHGSPLYEYVQMALDKLSRYSELGLEV
jgi:tetratricopeptide (TPR) repeat protein